MLMYVNTSTCINICLHISVYDKNREHKIINPADLQNREQMFTHSKHSHADKKKKTATQRVQ